MDFNNINARLKRLYNLLDQQYDYNIASNIKEEITKQSDGKFILKISFGNSSQEEMENKVLNIIHLIASLKDHIKNKLHEQGKRRQSFEDLISNTRELAIIVDIDNMDKHGEPLGNPRSNLRPRLSNLQQGLSPIPNQEKFSFALRSTFDGKPSSIDEMQGEFRIVISGDVIDGNNIVLMPISDLLTNSIDRIEEFIDENNLLM